VNPDSVLWRDPGLRSMPFTSAGQGADPQSVERVSPEREITLQRKGGEQPPAYDSETGVPARLEVYGNLCLRYARSLRVPVRQTVGCRTIVIKKKRPRQVRGRQGE
jgi:hypothetical protein